MHFQVSPSVPAVRISLRFRFAEVRIFFCSAETDFIPNDVAIGGEAKNLTLLTGPNVRRDSEDRQKESQTDLSLCVQMAGKSTLLRMTCTAVIMAQRKPTFRSVRRHPLL